MSRQVENSEKVYKELLTHPDGLTALDISELTKLPLEEVEKHIALLRNKRKIFTKDPKINSNSVWESKAKDVPYPDLDRNHREWCKQTKTIYNPWERP